MIGAIDFVLLNRYQRDFPLVARPYAEIGRQLGIDEKEVIASYERLAARGVLGRIGALFRPNTVGASLLAALAVPEGDLERVAQMVSAHPEVNHNYEREHEFNLWFVVAAPDAAQVAAVLERIERETGLAALRLPLVEEFHIDLGFDLKSGHVPRGVNPAVGASPLDGEQRRLVRALAAGLPLVAEPYEALGRAAGLSGAQVIERLRQWLASGVLRRLGTVVRHRTLGYTANAMVVWDVPDDAVSEAGEGLARQAEVTLCYRRLRRPPRWNYNLFCMLHGTEREQVSGAIERVTRAAGLDVYPREVLFSRRCFAQRAARYGAAHG
jgi:DNA-binding Lrp family transcriptional regulator